MEFAMTEREPWVKDTRFGDWFQSTEIWSQYVLSEAVEVLVQLLRATPDARVQLPRVLDVGCGTGAALPLIARHLQPSEIVAVDIDLQMVRGARIRAREVDCPVEVLRENVEKLTLASESFDIVLCHQTVHHVNHATEAVNELHRVLKPGGWLLCGE